MKRSLLIYGLAALFAITLSLGVDAFLSGVRYMHAKAEQNNVETSQREANARMYHDCIRERYPTLTYGAFGGYVDKETGERYNVAGTYQDGICQKRVYGR